MSDLDVFIRAAYAISDMAGEANFRDLDNLGVILGDPEDGMRLLSSLRNESYTVEHDHERLVEMFPGKTYRFADIRGVRFYWPTVRYALKDGRTVYR